MTGGTMSRVRAIEIDNRDSGQVYEYLEARVEAMKRRIAELESENVKLTLQLLADQTGEGNRFVASA
jgi:hypothetical protein